VAENSSENPVASGNRQEIQTSRARPISKLATGFEFAEGICSDSKGNVYFCDSRLRRIYKWSSESRSMTLLADYPWETLVPGLRQK